MEFTSKFNIELVNGEGGTAELCYCDAAGAYKKYAEQSKVYLEEGEKVWISAVPAEGYSVKAVKAGPQGKISLQENADGYYEYSASADDQNTGKISVTVSYEPISKKKVVLNVYGAKYRHLDGSAAYASGCVSRNRTYGICLSSVIE